MFGFSSLLPVHFNWGCTKIGVHLFSESIITMFLQWQPPDFLY